MIALTLGICSWSSLLCARLEKKLGVFTELSIRIGLCVTSKVTVTGLREGPPTSVRKPGPAGAMQLGERALLTWLGTAVQIYMLLHSGHAQIVVCFTSTCTSSVQNLRTTNSDHPPRRVSISGPGGKRPSQADSRERGDQKKVST